MAKFIISLQPCLLDCETMFTRLLLARCAGVVDLIDLGILGATWEGHWPVGEGRTIAEMRPMIGGGVGGVGSRVRHTLAESDP